MITLILNSYGRLYEYNMWYQEENTARTKLRDDLLVFKADIINLFSALLMLLERLKPDHYFEATLDFYAKVLSFEKPDEFYLRSESKHF